MTRCPYCDIEVSESAIEAEDGCCPECGTMLSTRSQFLDDDEDLEEELDSEYDDLDEDDDYVDEDRLNDEALFDDEDFNDEDFRDFDDDDGDRY